jgi:CheY-like chemotaxis protein
MTAPLLIVDDNDELRELLDAALTERGNSVITAGDGREAIACVEASGVRPWLVLLDLHMPVMDGAAFLAASATHPLLAQVPVVIMTSDADPPIDLPPIVRAVLAKPVPLTKLFESIDRVAKERRAPSPSVLANGTGAIPEVALADASMPDPDPVTLVLAREPVLVRDPIDGD